MRDVSETVDLPSHRTLPHTLPRVSHHRVQACDASSAMILPLAECFLSTHTPAFIFNFSHVILLVVGFYGVPRAPPSKLAVSNRMICKWSLDGSQFVLGRENNSCLAERTIRAWPREHFVLGRENTSCLAERTLRAWPREQFVLGRENNSCLAERTIRAWPRERIVRSPIGKLPH
jgi:hypothetical protein